MRSVQIAQTKLRNCDQSAVQMGAVSAVNVGFDVDMVAVKAFPGAEISVVEHVIQLLTTGEGSASDGCYGGGDADGFQIDAVCKGMGIDANHTFG